MWSFQTQYTQFQDMAQDQDTDHLTIGKRNINLGQKILETEIGYPPEEDSRTFTTTTSDIYTLPENFIKLISIYVTVGTTRYIADPVYDECQWQTLKRRTSGSSSNYMTHVFVRQKTFEVYPTPSSAGNTMTMIYESLSKDMTAADYTTGTITTLANLGTAVTGNGTTWTSAMIGRYFKINDDAQWYRISAVGSTTGLTIASPYQGTSIAAGTSAYTIGEIPKTPAATHVIPVYYALWKHFEGIRRDPKLGSYYKGLFNENVNWAKSTFGNRMSSGYIPSQRHLRSTSIVNPNWYPENLT
jgi:hypothetical protein